MSNGLCKDWRELSEAASQEKDPQKLLELVEQLNKALDRREQETNKPNPQTRLDARPACA